MAATPPRPPNYFVIAITSVVMAGLLLAPIPAGWLGLWQDKFLDIGHVPLFAALVVVLWAALGRDLRRSLIAAVVVAGLVEVVQPWVGRSGDWVDFVRGVLGALIGAAAVRAWEARRSWRGAILYLGLALVLAVWPVAELFPYAVDTVHGHRSFPVLADFTTESELLRWDCEQASITRVGAPDPPAGRLVLHPGPEPYSSGTMRSIVTDFRGYRWLCCAFRVTSGPVELVTSVRSGVVGRTGTTHAQVGRRFPTGDHLLRLDLPALAAKARPDPLELADIRCVQFFVVNTPEDVVLDISRVCLEP
ncbi:MAG TPA: hypothetical protein VH092_08230 [Urbifossiella sp.]|jgi:hypothetical protein|nr:hypothetical protein [Urbifossiella sp.]